jgi:hypothetical protein
MKKCKICNEEFKNLKALSTHFNLKHNLTSKEYFDQYILIENNNKCVVCGKETNFRGIGVGYLKNCSIECRNKNKNIKHDHWEGKKQSKKTIDKRVKNTNQIEKQKKLEYTIFNRYGVRNISNLDSVKNKISIGNTGKKSIRNVEWQNKIINSKRKNDTLKHSNDTKIKISNSLNEYHKENLDREKYISKSNNVKSISGWYNGLHFRSSLELSFLVKFNNITLISCEKKEYKILYEKNNKIKVYYPDFTDGKSIYEIKPTNLLNYKDNELKIKRGFEIYGTQFNVITEKEVPYIEKKIIFDLITNGEVILTKKSYEILEKYRY